MYGLHPLMPIEYIVIVVGGNGKDDTLMRVLTNIIINLKKLQEANLQAVKTTEHYGVNKRIHKNNLVLVIMFCDFQRAISHT
jgi:hypothetical protein